MKQSPEINGKPPALIGAICEDLRCQQYWYRDELKDEVNAVFLCFNGMWHRLCFDCGVIFWRIADTAPISIELPATDIAYRIVDLGIQLGLRGLKLERYEMKSVEGGSQVEFIFSGGRSLHFQNIDDHTSVVEQPG